MFEMYSNRNLRISPENRGIVIKGPRFHRGEFEKKNIFKRMVATSRRALCVARWVATAADTVLVGIRRERRGGVAYSQFNNVTSRVSSGIGHVLS